MSIPGQSLCRGFLKPARNRVDAPLRTAGSSRSGIRCRTPRNQGSVGTTFVDVAGKTVNRSMNGQTDRITSYGTTRPNQPMLPPSLVAMGRDDDDGRQCEPPSELGIRASCVRQDHCTRKAEDCLRTSIASFGNPSSAKGAACTHSARSLPRRKGFRQTQHTCTSAHQTSP